MMVFTKHLTCINLCPAGNFSARKGNNPVFKISTYKGPSMVPSNVIIFVGPFKLIPAQMCNLVGCFGLSIWLGPNSIAVRQRLDLMMWCELMKVLYKWKLRNGFVLGRLVNQQRVNQGQCLIVNYQLFSQGSLTALFTSTGSMHCLGMSILTQCDHE